MPSSPHLTSSMTSPLLLLLLQLLPCSPSPLLPPLLLVGLRPGATLTPGQEQHMACSLHTDMVRKDNFTLNYSCQRRMCKIADLTTCPPSREELYLCGVCLAPLPGRTAPPWRSQARQFPSGDTLHREVRHHGGKMGKSPPPVISGIHP